MLLPEGDGPGTGRISQGAGDPRSAGGARYSHTEWQRDLTVNHEKIGEVLVAQGDGPGLWQSTVKGWPSPKRLWRAMQPHRMAARSFGDSRKIGDVLVAQGDRPGALAEYRKELAIAEALAARDAANADWQRVLIVSLVKMSEVTGDKAFVARALNLALDLQRRGTLALSECGLVDLLRRRAAQ